MNRYVSLPKAAKEAATRGDLLSAIKLTQETMGVGLQDAQQAVHAYVRDGESAAASSGENGANPAIIPNSTFRAPGSALPPQALAALNRGNLIEAIKHTRSATGLGLKEAKDAVESHLATSPAAKLQFQNAVGKTSVNLAPIIGVLVLVMIAAGGFATYVFMAK